MGSHFPVHRYFGLIFLLSSAHCSIYDGLTGDTATPSDAGPQATLDDWLKLYGGREDDISNQLAVDAQGNIYAVGAFSNKLTFDNIILDSAGETDIFIASWTSSGEIRWARSFGAARPDTATALALASSGELIVAGKIQSLVDFGQGQIGSDRQASLFVGRFSSEDGRAVWTVDTPSSIDDIINDIEIAPDNSALYLTGAFESSIVLSGNALTSQGGVDIFVASYQVETGDALWAKSFGSRGDDNAVDIAISDQGDLYVCGGFGKKPNSMGPMAELSIGDQNLVSKGGIDIFWMKLDKSGTPKYSTSFGGSNNDRCSGVVVDKQEQVYLTGVFRETVQFSANQATPLTSFGSSDVFVASYDAAGEHLWSNRYGGIEEDESKAIIQDNDGRLFITGYFMNSGYFGGDRLMARGAEDIFIASFNNEGSYRWSSSYGGFGSDLGTAIAATPEGALMVTGYYTDMAYFGDKLFGSKGEADFFLMSLAP